MTAIAGPISRVGCSVDEIRALETKYNITLPRTYRVFLETMGKSPGRLFHALQVHANYTDVLELTAEIPRQIKLENPDRYTELARFLPADALIVASWDLDANLLIRCDRADDSPVWYFDGHNLSVTECHESVVEWLYDCLWHAEDAVKSGWYDQWKRPTSND